MNHQYNWYKLPRQHGSHHQATRRRLEGSFVGQGATRLHAALVKKRRIAVSLSKAVLIASLQKVTKEMEAVDTEIQGILKEHAVVPIGFWLRGDQLVSEGLFSFQNQKSPQTHQAYTLQTYPTTRETLILDNLCQLDRLQLVVVGSLNPSCRLQLPVTLLEWYHTSSSQGFVLRSLYDVIRFDPCFRTCPWNLVWYIIFFHPLEGLAYLFYRCLYTSNATS